MSNPDTPRNAHPRVDIADAYAETVNDELRAAIAESPTGAVRVYYPGDTDESADIVTLDATDMLATVDTGTD